MLASHQNGSLASLISFKARLIGERFLERLFWAGAFGTYFWVDPHEKLFAVMMVQMPFEQSGYYRRAFRELVYGALLR
jgi:CubicO group peptidase (beta-lactamase class C family)